jgi:hypothetical protein
VVETRTVVSPELHGSTSECGTSQSQGSNTHTETGSSLLDGIEVGHAHNASRSAGAELSLGGDSGLEGAGLHRERLNEVLQEFDRILQ